MNSSVLIATHVSIKSVQVLILNLSSRVLDEFEVPTDASGNFKAKCEFSDFCELKYNCNVLINYFLKVFEINQILFKNHCNCNVM